MINNLAGLTAAQAAVFKSTASLYLKDVALLHLLPRCRRPCCAAADQMQRPALPAALQHIVTGHEPDAVDGQLCSCLDHNSNSVSRMRSWWLGSSGQKWCGGHLGTLKWWQAAAGHIRHRDCRPPPPAQRAAPRPVHDTWRSHRCSPVQQQQEDFFLLQGHDCSVRRHAAKKNSPSLVHVGYTLACALPGVVLCIARLCTLWLWVFRNPHTDCMLTPIASRKSVSEGSSANAARSSVLDD